MDASKLEGSNNKNTSIGGLKQLSATGHVNFGFKQASLGSRLIFKRTHTTSYDNHVTVSICIATSNKKLLGAPSLTTRSILTTSNKKLLVAPGIATDHCDLFQLKFFPCSTFSCVQLGSSALRCLPKGHRKCTYPAACHGYMGD